MYLTMISQEFSDKLILHRATSLQSRPGVICGFIKNFSCIYKLPSSPSETMAAFYLRRLPWLFPKLGTVI